MYHCFGVLCNLQVVDKRRVGGWVYIGKGTKLVFFLFT